MGSKAGLAVAGGAILVFVAMLLTPMASATNFGPNSDYEGGSCCRYANNFYHELFYYDVVESTANAADAVRNNILDPTVINTNRTYAHDDSDVSIIDAYYDADWAGLYSCPDVSNSNDSICHHAHVQIDLSNTEGGNYDWAEKKHLMCQELGHSLGLTHDPPDNGRTTCMQNPVTLGFDHLHDHDKNHLSNRYGS